MPTDSLKIGRIRGSGELSSRAVALLVFLAGSAGAGVVAAHFGTGPDGFWRLRLRRSGLKLQVFLLSALALFDLFRLILGFCRLHQEKEADGLCVDAVHQLVEQGEGFLFELDQRVLRTVPAAADAL